jgi:hypothetical protein
VPPANRAINPGGGSAVGVTGVLVAVGATLSVDVGIGLSVWDTVGAPTVGAGG